MPLVPGTTHEPRCEVLDLPEEMPGHRMVSLVYGTPTQRRVSVSLDSLGHAISYADLRGDLNVRDSIDGDFTSISLDFEQQKAYGMNRPAGGESGILIMPIDEALEAENLGAPREMMALLMARCSEGA